MCTWNGSYYKPAKQRAVEVKNSQKKVDIKDQDSKKCSNDGLSISRFAVKFRNKHRMVS